MKKQNGITLIALIITIIVMLILVAVTVTVALNGGLFNKVKEAGNKSEMETERERLLSSALASMGTNGEVDYTMLNTILPTGFTETNGIYTDKHGNEFVVSKNGIVSNFETLEHIIISMNAEINSNPEEWNGTNEELSGRLMTLIDELGVEIKQTYDGESFYEGEGYIMIPLDIAYNEEETKIFLKWEVNTTMTEENFQVLEVGFIPTIEEVIAQINADIDTNPTDYKGFTDYGTNTIVPKIKSILNSKNITPPNVIDEDNVTLDQGLDAVITFNVNYLGEQAALNVTLKRHADNNRLYDIISLSKDKDIEEVVAEINEDIKANPDQYSRLTDAQVGGIHDKFSSIFEENNIKPPADLDDTGIVRNGNTATVRYNVDYNGSKMQITFEVEIDADTELMTIKSMAIKSIEQIIEEINTDIEANSDDWSGISNPNTKLGQIFNKYNIIADGDPEKNIEGTTLIAVIQVIYKGESKKIKVLAQMISETAMNVTRFELTE